MSYEGKKRRYFTGTEIVLWISSVILILVSFFDFWRKFLYFLDCVLNRCNRFDFHCKRFQHGELNTEHTVCNNKFYGCVLNIQTQSILCLLVCRKRCNFDCFVVIGSCRKYIVYVRCGMFRCFFANDIYGFAN